MSPPFRLSAACPLLLAIALAALARSAHAAGALPIGEPRASFVAPSRDGVVEPRMPFSLCRLDALTIEDERAFRHVDLYADLKAVLVADRYTFRVLPASAAGRWDRALLLNLTFWGASEGGDVLAQRSIPADVVAHVAWHHLAAKALGPGPLSPAALFLGEAIASAFDLYLVGRLLAQRGRSSFLDSQVPAMAETAAGAGLGPAAFHALLERVAEDPAAAFEEVRSMLFEAAMTLYACDDAVAALSALAKLDKRPYAPLLHRFELSNWVLYARSFGARGANKNKAANATDAALRASKVSLEWLVREWLAPHVPASTAKPAPTKATKPSRVSKTKPLARR